MMFDRHGGSLRQLAVLGALAMALALLPLAGTASAQDGEDPLADCPVDAPEADFGDRDDIAGVHVRNVDCAAVLDIVRGFADGEYKPRLPVTRAQMAAFIFRTLRAADVDLPEPGEQRFADVGVDTAHDEAIHRLAAAGIVEGGPVGLGEEFYGPQLRTRRDQMASFLMRAAGYAFFGDPTAYERLYDDGQDVRFPDVPPGNVHFSHVTAANDFGIARGFDDGLYRPRASTRRDQMASFVVRLLNVLAEPQAFRLTVHTHTSNVGGPGGADTLFETAPMPAPISDAQEGATYSYSAIPCENPAPFNDVALTLPGYPGIDSPAAVRHFLELTITERDEDAGTGTIEGNLRTILCADGQETASEIHVALTTSFAHTSPNEVSFTGGEFQIVGGEGIFDTLVGAGEVDEGRLTCLPPILEREGAEDCEDLGFYSDAVGLVLEGTVSDPSPGAND